MKYFLFYLIITQSDGSIEVVEDELTNSQCVDKAYSLIIQGKDAGCMRIQLKGEYKWA